LVITPPGVTSYHGSNWFDYHSNDTLSFPEGYQNAFFGWIGNGLDSNYSDQDFVTLGVSAMLGGALTDPNAGTGPYGYYTLPGSSWPYGVVYGDEIDNFEPQFEFNSSGSFTSYSYRLNGSLTQALWDSGEQAFTVSDGTVQNFIIYPQYTYNAQTGNYEYDGNQLVIDGDQLGSGYNDTITINTNSNGNLIVTLNGETATFDPGQITSINVYAGSGSNSVNVLATPAGTPTYIDDTGNDTVVVGNYNGSVNNGAGSLGNIQGSVDVYGSGSTALYLDDSGDSVGRNVVLYDGSISYSGSAPIYYTPTASSSGGVSYLAVYGGNGGYGGNTFTVDDTSNLAAGTYLSTGNGNDTVNVYATQGGLYDYNPAGYDNTNVGAGHTGLLNGFVYVYGAGTTKLYINDSLTGVAQTVTMGDGSVTGLGSGGIYWAPSSSKTGGVTYVEVDGGSGGNTFNVNNTSNLYYQTLLNTGIGNDTVNVYGTTGQLNDYNPGGVDVTNIGLGNMGSINGLVDVYGPGATVLDLNDSSDTTARTVTMDNGVVTGLGGGTGGIYWDPTLSATSGTLYVEVDGGSAANTFNVNNTSNAYYGTYLYTGTGNDTVNVYATKSSAGTGGLYVYNEGGAGSVDVGLGSVANINGFVDVEGYGTATMLVDDHLDSTARTATLSNGTLTGLGNAGAIQYLGIVTSLTIDGPSKASTYNLQSTPSGTAVTVNGGVGSDTFNLGVGNSLSGLQGALTLNGGGGTNTLNANDSSSATGQSYSLSSTQLAGTDFATITYAPASLHAINVTGSGNDTLTLLSSLIAATTFNGGSGTNTLVGPSASSTTTWTISGANSGKVDNLTFSNFQNLVGGTSSDAFDFTTSTASLSGTLNGGGGTNNNNTISYATLGSSYLVSVTLTSNTSGTATHIGGGFSNINDVVGSSDIGNTLQGPNSTNQWTITGTNAGNLYTGSTRYFYFTCMGHLVGGTGVDTFRFDSASDKVVGINGGGAPAGQGDWLKYSSFPSSSTVTVNLATGSATDVNNGAAGAVTNIQNVLGTSSGTNVLTGDSQGNILIGGSGSNTIVGGSGSSLLIGGSGHGTVTGGSGTDILIAGATTYNAATVAGEDSLMAILGELQSSDTFAQKVSDIINGNNSGGGHDLNGTNKLTWGGTVRASTGAFTLSGDSGSSSNPDWFFSSSPSTVTDFNDDGVQDEHNNNAIGTF
jgi:hypothetical protein